MDPIRIGLIGTGGRAAIAKFWQQDDSERCRVVAAADTNPLALESFKEWADADAFVTDDYRLLLQQADIDAIAIFTPDYLHEEHAIAALKAGKHLFLEKPMALSTEACDRVLKAWHEAGTHLMIGFNMRYMPVITRAKELVDNGAIGSLKSIWVRHFVGAGGDYYFHDWHALRNNSESLLLQKGSHDIDLIHWLGGAYTESVSAFGDRDFFGGDRHNSLTCTDCPDSGTCTDRQAEDNPRQECAFREEVDVEDNQVVIMRLKNGVKAAYLQCHFTPDYLRNYTLIGTEGRIEMEVERNKIWLIKRPHGRTWEKEPLERIDCHPDLDSLDGGHGGADPELAKAFMDLLCNDVRPLSTPIDGRMSVAAGCAAVDSLRADGGLRKIALPKTSQTSPSLPQ